MRRQSNMIRVPIHFVWTTQDRLPLIPSQGERRLWRFIETICTELHCDPLAIGGMADHVHLLVNFANTLSFADFMKRVKGSTSRFITQELRDGEFFGWQAHYGAFAVSPDHVATVVAYINGQKQHHADGSVCPNWETACAEIDVDDPPSTP